MAKKFFEVQPGNEIRGLRIRLYPDKDTELKLVHLERDLRYAWNWLVKQTEEVWEARKAYAVRWKLIEPRPERPNYDGMTPDDAKASAEKYRRACAKWNADVYASTNKIEACGYRKFSDLLAHFGDKFDYQLLKRVIGWCYEDGQERPIQPGAHTLQALTKNYMQKSARRKRFRRSIDSMPLQTRSGVCFELGNFGERRGNPFYNCQIKFNGQKIRGRLPGMAPAGRVLEGVSIIREADGWWASIKQEVPIRVRPPAEPGTVVGLDVGLDNIVAFSDGRRLENPRGKAYAERIAGRQALKKPVGRLQQAASKQVLHLLYNEVVKPLAHVEVIKIEKLNGRIGQMGSSKQSVMRKVVTLLKERYGDRVREVEPSYTSQDCSQCGHRSKESWSYEHGRYGECPQCGYRADRDVNAARNIAAKELISLAA